ncbi:glycosyltransferase family 4 protein [Sphingobium subterraneum]|uniref:Glycosyltransferase involved in cell wall biosynthesis n=1 Tax=Sphingobium subterraneum TaxID=627688 RepID=A0A841IZ98_9SPHN|nr:glycosyltransferase family 4 protein [Sphingobium subterraneum]MBB6122606.1 glycosyltransferase involved in cell wall biosynthesis [Sphingobium subterraneum]
MAEPAGRTPRILHCHSGFDLGGKEARAVRLMNHWGGRLRHTILSAMPDAMGARAMIDPSVPCTFPQDDPASDAPSLQGLPAPGRYWQWARYMQQFDLVLSYNWGSMDAVMAHRMFSPWMRLPPLIHHEDGFNEDEAQARKPKRNHFRHLALARAHALVVPSQILRGIAHGEWGQPEARIRAIPNGIDVDSYAYPAAPDAIPGFVRQPGKIVVGTLAGLRRVKNLARLVRVVAPLADRVQLVIVGEGPDREAIAAQARASGVTDVHMPGFLAHPAHFMGLFDIFALSSDSEQFPISLVEAMAAGLPALSTDVGDVMAMVAEENHAFVIPRDEESRMTGALAQLVDDAHLRRRVGAANQARAQRDFAETVMIARYAALYGTALKQGLD